MMNTDPLIGDGWDDVELVDDEVISSDQQIVVETKSSHDSKVESNVLKDGESVLQRMENKTETEISSFHVGSGFFIGRLTRLLDPTIPKSVDEDVDHDDGWKEDSFDLDDVDTESMTFQDISHRNSSYYTQDESIENEATFTDSQLKRTDTAALEIAEAGGSRSPKVTHAASPQDYVTHPPLEPLEGIDTCDLVVVNGSIDCESNISTASDGKNIFVNGHINEAQQQQQQPLKDENQQYQPNLSTSNFNHYDETEIVSSQPQNGTSRKEDSLENCSAKATPMKLEELEQKLLLANERWEELHNEYKIRNGENESAKVWLQGEIETLTKRIVERDNQIHLLEYLSSEQKSTLTQYEEKISHLQYTLDCTLYENGELRDAVERIKSEYIDKVSCVEESAQQMNNQNVELRNQLTTRLLQKETFSPNTENSKNNDVSIVSVKKSLCPKIDVTLSEDNDSTNIISQLNRSIVELEESLQASNKQTAPMLIQRNNLVDGTVDDYIMKCNQLSMEYSDISYNLQQVTGELQEIKITLSERDRSIPTLESECLRMSKVVLDKDSRIVELEQTIKDLKHKETDNITELNQLSTENERITSSLQRIKAEKDSLTEILDSRNQVISSLENDYLRISSEILDNNRRVLDLEKTIEVLNLKETTLTTNLKDLSVDNDELLLKLHRIVDENECLTKSLDKSNKTISLLESDCLRISHDTDDKDRQILELHVTVDAMNRNRIQMMTLNEELSLKNDELSLNLKQMKDESDSLKICLEQRDQTISLLESECYKMRIDIDEKDRRILEQLDQEFERRNDKKEALYNFPVLNEQTISCSKNQLIQLNDRVRELETVNSDLLEQSRLFAQDKASLQSKVDAQSTEIQKLKEENEEILVQLGYFITKSDETKDKDVSESGTWSQEKIALLNQIECLNVTVGGLETELLHFDSIKQEYCLLKANVDDLRQRFSNHDSSRDNAYQEIVFILEQNSIEMLHQEKVIASLREDLESLKVKNSAIEEEMVITRHSLEEYDLLTGKLAKTVQRFSKHGSDTGILYLAIVDILEENERKLSHQESEIRLLQDGLESYQARYFAIDKELGNAKSLIDSLQTKLEHDSNLSRNQNDAYKESDVEYVTDLESMLKVKSEDNHTLVERLSQKEEHIAELHSTVDKMGVNCNAMIEKLSNTVNEQAEEIGRLRLMNNSIQKHRSTEQMSIRLEEFIQLQEDYRKVKEALDRKISTESYVDIVNTLSVRTHQNDMSLKEEVIRLALALERSEMKRADTLEELVNERKTYAANLKTIHDSLKQVFVSL